MFSSLLLINGMSNLFRKCQMCYLQSWVTTTCELLFPNWSSLWPPSPKHHFHFNSVPVLEYTINCWKLTQESPPLFPLFHFTYYSWRHFNFGSAIKYIFLWVINVRRVVLSDDSYWVFRINSSFLSSLLSLLMDWWNSCQISTGIGWGFIDWQCRLFIFLFYGIWVFN